MIPHPTFPQLLEKRRQIIQNKPELQFLYELWAKRIRRSMGPGPSVELGSGSSPMKKYLPNVFFSDQSAADCYDVACKTDHLPFLKESIGNLILFDVFHHLNDPVQFLKEAENCLKPGGRIIIYDLAITPFSYLFFNISSKEKAFLEEDPYLPKETRCLPMRGNPACLYLMFTKYKNRFQEMFPTLKILENKKRDMVCFPLLRGYEFTSKIPPKYYPFLQRLEKY